MKLHIWEEKRIDGKEIDDTILLSPPNGNIQQVDVNKKFQFFFFELSVRL